MKVQRDSKKQKGFTLVELLIVIVIIGILAGAMMMLMGSSTDKAEATKVVSDLRTMKGAAMQYYSDHNSMPGDQNDGATALRPYVDKNLSDDYALLNVGTGFYVGRTVPSAGAFDKLKDYAQLESMDIWYGGADAATIDSGKNLGGTADLSSVTWDGTNFVFVQAK